MVLSERFLAAWTAGGFVAVSRSSFAQLLFQPQLLVKTSFSFVVMLAALGKRMASQVSELRPWGSGQPGPVERG